MPVVTATFSFPLNSESSSVQVSPTHREFFSGSLHQENGI